MKQINAEILTIGDEILYGQITDTNSQWMSAELDQLGIKVVRKTTVGDTEEAILTAFEEAESRADIILITGGLGPTNDDLTMPMLARYFDSEIIMNEAVLNHVKDFFERRGRVFTELNKRQALVPKVAQVLHNELGTAPGTWYERNGKVFVSMPGVPHEMKNLMKTHVLPKLQQVFQTPVIYHKLIKTVGIGESFLADKIKVWEDNLPEHVSLAYLPSVGHVKLRLTAVGENREQLEKDVDLLIKSFLPLGGDYVYGYDNTTLEEAVGDILKKTGKTIAFAESCSGGYVQHKITTVAGSSAYFQGGVVPYHNDHKINLLGVRPETLEEHGAVSGACVKEMAEGVRKLFKADIGAASSGIAGPGGGTSDKPVGTVWIAYADGEKTITKKLQLTQNRELNIKLTEIAVLNLVRKRFTT
ncbi:competence/damage-inducible protein A [Roseivirga pacifica]|uniref:competence/damage-inducible protein A n=1 Tax=Roseivirga pacifica TaxID=1267423 RepID=UPI002095DF07|nr:competence/damage-inducible protein A [Roseivirga pacifica]MCO6360240.1 competence/damage-inducible protein A [Roseivirga pacifica]MCO6367611.1 competence/damage-inducible protein A [Roseivirga pacifica]MCO6369857.1 competence/damage-inducible protein A [Roseivirga pacifica]MCO6375268.1 competence/damage-inducible protein A [Roseivirga pacifica]MCO6380526.1 competence/damage-inducible protein A [Roseivirga pacifica]